MPEELLTLQSIYEFRVNNPAISMSEELHVIISEFRVSNPVIAMPEKIHMTVIEFNINNPVIAMPGEIHVNQLNTALTWNSLSVT